MNQGNERGWGKEAEREGQVEAAPNIRHSHYCIRSPLARGNPTATKDYVRTSARLSSRAWALQLDSNCTGRLDSWRVQSLGTVVLLHVPAAFLRVLKGRRLLSRSQQNGTSKMIHSLLHTGRVQFLVALEISNL